MKRTLSIVLALVMLCAVLTGCGGGGDTSTPPENTKSASEQVIDSIKQDTKAEDPVVTEREKPIKVTVALSNSVSLYTPIMQVNPYNNIVASGVYERLAERSEYGSSDFIGVLLKSWEPYNDSYSYHCEIFDYITDSDGNHMTAEDIKFAIETQGGDGNKTQARKATEITVTGDYTFDITFSENYEGFFIEFCENLWMFTRAAYEKSVANNSICAGTGPYVCTDFMSNSYAIVEKRDDYWQTDDSLRAITSRANVDLIRYNIVSEVTQMAIAIDSPNDTQMCGFVVESLVEDAVKNSEKNKVTVTSIASAKTNIIMFNCSENSLCKDENLRKAICYALNNDICIATTYSGVGFVPKTLGAPTLTDYEQAWEEQEYYPYNIEKAREYLAAAGYNPDNAGITLTWGCNNNVQNVNNGAWIAGCLAELGITVETVPYESASSSTYRNDLASGWDMFEMGQTPSNTLNYLYYSSYGDESLHAGHTSWGEYDADFQALVERVKVGDHDAWEEYRQFLIDEAVMYQFAGSYYVVTHVDTITNVACDYRGSICVGACTFSPDYSYFA